MRLCLSFSRYALVIGAMLFAIGGTHKVNAQLDSGVRPIYVFSTVGVARGQQARLNVFYHNIYPPGPCVPGDRCFPPGPCAPGASCSFVASLSFTDCDGNLVARNDVNLIPDKGGSLVFTPGNFGADGRACARATVTVQPDANGFTPDLMPSVEVLDMATGQSMLLNPGAISGFNPQPEPPGDRNFGLFNVIKGQTARVSASFLSVPDGFPPGPCRVTLSFYGGDGALLSQSIQSVDLGKTVSFDYSTASFPTGARARIRASISVDPLVRESTIPLAPEERESTIPLFIGGVEVFAADTGRGALYYPGTMIGNH